MRTILPAIILLYSATLHAQSYYYYTDILATEDMNRQMQTYIQNRVKSITASGYTPQGSKATDFSELYEIRENGQALRVSSIVNFNTNITYNRFTSEGKLTSISDTSAGITGMTRFEYDETGRIKRIENTIKDDEKEGANTEVHEWIYSAAGIPEKMWKIKNGIDSTEIRFVTEEHGLPGEEISYRRGVETDHVYYYYDDDKNRLTDIVRFNKSIKKLVPEIILTYDEDGRVIQKIISAEGDNYGIKSLGRIVFVRYLIWRYIYNQQGLKTKEALFDKSQEMTGKIEYAYRFNE
jgi:antitoxin component YwqK of YwqJK toxin-antitoxin module